METNDYLAFKKYDHLIVSILFTIAYFLYIFAMASFSFPTVLLIIAVIFIAWAMFERQNRRALLSLIVPKYKEVMNFEQVIAPEAHHNYRISLRISLLLVGTALFVISILQSLGTIQVDETMLTLPVIYPIALVVVNVNVHSRYKRMLAERKLS
ncbi:hypothetical protein [Geomicrobium sp. JCM 19038]|uniref:hypothetical protein n=1 Tax=Geomicrobium sp. JCM 19038 TaxID=1460635 RepID=UPI00045F2194|nr:hypothetical protein [Geomicrobium sp. JCM 19038]GAK10044.1 hypothetical protein JCM19038_3923 [Geomicrobium sp. JCM 19038]